MVIGNRVSTDKAQVPLTFSMVANSSLITEHFGILALPAFDTTRETAPAQAILIVNQEGKAQVRTWGIQRPRRGGLLTLQKAGTMARESACQGAARCLIPATGFFCHSSGKKYFIDLGCPVFAIAGLLVGRRVALLTCKSNRKMAKIHDQMPVILHRSDYAKWTDDGGTKLLRPYTGKIVATVQK